MKFNPVALDAKIKHLDEILKNAEILNEVMSRNLKVPFKIVPMSRVWGAEGAGGGSSLFRIETSNDPIFLKVKHESVLVESQLESESSSLKISSLQNEYNFLQLLNFEWMPKLVFFDKQEGFEFIATEWLETFDVVMDRLNMVQMLEMWKKIVEAVEILYKKEIVHTDIHEYNIGFRGDQFVLLDFEEARYLKQEVSFSQSLDVVGINKYGDVGNFPKGHGISGYTCLARLRKIWVKKMKEKLPEFLVQCSFGQECPYNLDALQEPDSRIYQSVNCGKDIAIAGQRPLSDSRPKMICALLKGLATKDMPITYMDIGSNLGSFCIEASEIQCVSRIVGIEADRDYIIASRAIAFIKNIESVEFYKATCGEDSIKEMVNVIDFVSLFSVYHHIKNKSNFLNDINQIKPKYLVAEFATQDRFYPERGNLKDEIIYMKKVLGFEYIYTITSSKDYNRPIIIFSHMPVDAGILILCKWTMFENQKFISNIINKIRNYLGQRFYSIFKL